MFVRAERSSAASGLSLQTESDMLARAIGVEKNRAHNRSRHVPVFQRNVHGFADAAAPTFNQRERDRTTEADTVVAGSNVTEHRHRRLLHIVGDDLAAFG